MCKCFPIFVSWVSWLLCIWCISNQIEISIPWMFRRWWIRSWGTSGGNRPHSIHQNICSKGSSSSINFGSNDPLHRLHVLWSSWSSQSEASLVWVRPELCWVSWVSWVGSNCSSTDCDRRMHLLVALLLTVCADFFRFIPLPFFPFPPEGMACGRLYGLYCGLGLRYGIYYTTCNDVGIYTVSLMIDRVDQDGGCLQVNTLKTPGCSQPWRWCARKMDDQHG